MYNHIYFVYRSETRKCLESHILPLLQLLKKKNNVKLVLLKKPENNIEIINDILKEYNLNEDVLMYNFKKHNLIFNNKNIFRKIANDIIKNVDFKYKILFHCRGDQASFVAIKIKQIISSEKIKVLFDNRGVPIEEDISSNLFSIIKKFIHIKYLKYASKHCDIFSFVTNNLRVFMINNYHFSANKAYIIVPTCVNKKEIYKKNNNISRIRYIYVGGVQYWQNIEEVIKLFKLIRNINKKADFTLLVNNVNKVKNICLKYKIDANIRNVKHKEVFKYLSKSQVGILLRDNSIINKVAAPTKFSEYIASRLKVIYSGDIGIIDDCKKYMNIDKVAFNINKIKLNEIIERIWNNQCDNEEKMDIKYFFWQTHINKYEEILNSIYQNLVDKNI